MLKAKIHNLLTDQKYEFIAADQAEIDARLERKAGVYGRTAWTETIPAWIDDTTDPMTVHGVETIEHPAEHTIEIIDTAPEEQAARIAVAWTAANAAAEAGADQNARARYLAWLIDPACPQARKDKILAVQAWMDAIWTSYAIYKASPVGDFVLPADPCPHSFWDIAS
jgi:hypothetical protein